MLEETLSPLPKQRNSLSKDSLSFEHFLSAKLTFYHFHVSLKITVAAALFKLFQNSRAPLPPTKKELFYNSQLHHNQTTTSTIPFNLDPL